MNDLIYKKNINCRTRKIGNKTYLFGNGNAFELNNTAYFIWDNIDGKQRLSTILEKLANSYEVDPILLKEDIDPFLKILFEEEAILEKEQ